MISPLAFIWSIIDFNLAFFRLNSTCWTVTFPHLFYFPFCYNFRVSDWSDCVFTCFFFTNVFFLPLFIFPHHFYFPFCYHFQYSKLLSSLFDLIAFTCLFYRHDVFLRFLFSYSWNSFVMFLFYVTLSKKKKNLLLRS